MCPDDRGIHYYCLRLMRGDFICQEDISATQRYETDITVAACIWYDIIWFMDF
jgi:hypothetical protein